MGPVSKTISEECSAVVFYGISPDARAAEGFYRTVVEWFTSLGYPPDKVAITGPGHGGKLGSFTRGNAKLQKRGFDGIANFEINSSTPNALTGHGYFLTGTYGSSSEDLFADVVARSSIATLSPTSMLPIARALAKVLRPAYGIGYTMAHRNGPELYAVGINFGNEEPTEESYQKALTVSRWCDTGMVKKVWDMGLLRDVYPWNFLTKNHLDELISGIPLKKWIQEDKRRGKLSPLTETNSLWEIEETEIPHVREILFDQEIIFDWRKFLVNEIFRDYGLNWEVEWKKMVPYLGKNPKKYFPLVVDIISQASRDADKDKDWFLKLINFHVKKPLKTDPCLLKPPPNGPLPAPPGCKPGEPAKNSLKYLGLPELD